MAPLFTLSKKLKCAVTHRAVLKMAQKLGNRETVGYTAPEHRNLSGLRMFCAVNPPYDFIGEQKQGGFYAD